MPHMTRVVTARMQVLMHADKISTIVATMRRQGLSPFLAVVLLVLGSAAAQKRVLVLLQSDAAKEKYSQFLDGLRQSGFDVDAKPYKDPSLKLKEYDTWFYDHLITLVPKAEGFGGSVDLQAIVDFVDSGRNLVLGASSDVSDNIRALAAEVGIDLDEKGSKVWDHFNHVVLDGKADHAVIAASDRISNPAIIDASASKGPILFRGVAAVVPQSSELVTVALSAPFTAYSHDPRKAMPEPPALMAGSSVALVSLVQARNNARVMVSGSVDLFSNAFFDADVVLANGQKLGKAGNRDFALSAVRWTLQDRGVVKAEGLQHRLLSELNATESPSGYRVTDDVQFSVQLFEYKAGQRKPFEADDVQVELTMLDPHVRLPLKHDGKGTYSVRFKVPDVYGVFKYVVDYRKQGYSYVQLSQQVPVRPFRHNEYERFLVCAYPYYASAFSSMAAFFVLGFFFLYGYK